MHAQEIIKINFDPVQKDSIIRRIFEVHPAKVLWCLIKYNHITDSHFDSKIFELGQKIEEQMPEYYRDFLKIVQDLTNQFGRVTTDEFMFMGHSSEIDHEFWSDVYKAIKHKRCFNVEIALPEVETAK